MNYLKPVNNREFWEEQTADSEIPAGFRHRVVEHILYLHQEIDRLKEIVANGSQSQNQ